MKTTLRMLAVALAVLGLIAFTGCGNTTQNVRPAKAQCAKDADCQKSGKCNQCNGGKCVAVADCCETDADCGGGGKRCFTVSGKSYGKCSQ